jgi:hypothetical protein
MRSDGSDLRQVIGGNDFKRERAWVRGQIVSHRKTSRAPVFGNDP